MAHVCSHFAPSFSHGRAAAALLKACGKADTVIEAGRWTDSRSCRIYADRALLGPSQLVALSLLSLCDYLSPAHTKVMKRAVI